MLPEDAVVLLMHAYGILHHHRLAEIVGCYLPWLVLRQGKPWWLLLPAAVALALFAWLLTLHPTAAGRTYAAYGGNPYGTTYAQLGISPSDEYVTYGVIKTPESVDYYINGVKTYSWTKAERGDQHRHHERAGRQQAGRLQHQRGDHERRRLIIDELEHLISCQ